jgi:hypothetical protein
VFRFVFTNTKNTEIGMLRGAHVAESAAHTSAATQKYLPSPLDAEK